MSSRRQIILSLKQKTDLSFLDKLNEKTHDSAYDIYLELQDLKDNEKVNLPETLLTKIKTLLLAYNDTILQIVESDKILRNTSELLKKETQLRIHFEENHKTQLRNNETFTTEIELEKQISQGLHAELENRDLIISKLKYEVSDLKQATQLQPPPIGQEQVITEPKTSTAKASNAAAPGSSVQNETAVFPSLPPRPEYDTQQQSNTDIKNVFLIGDSHCRDMQPCIKQFVKSDCRVNCVAHPGKTLEYVVDSIKPNKLSKNTEICIFAGTNDVFKTKFEDLTKSLQKLHNKCRQFKVVIILIPPRFDRRHMNPHIVKLNSKLKHVLNSFDNFTHIDLTNFIQLSHFSNDGLHLNRKGKTLVSRKLVTKIFGTAINNTNFMPTYMNRSKINNPTQYHQPRHNYRNKNTYTKHNRVASHTSTPTAQCSHQSNLPCLVHGDFLRPPPIVTPNTYPISPYNPSYVFPPPQPGTISTSPHNTNSQLNTLPLTHPSHHPIIQTWECHQPTAILC